MMDQSKQENMMNALDKFLFGEVLREANETARDHCLNPRNLGAIADSDAQAIITGPCGDTMEIYLKISDDTIQRAGFMTDGCGYTIACGSIATEMLIGSKVSDALKIDQHKIEERLGGLPEEYRHCALLTANTIRKAQNSI
jgi:nitrogen fixation protein NifU and related proteins